MPVSITASSLFFIFSSRRRHTRFDCDWSSDVCSSDLFSHHLPPDQYELRVKFDAHGGVLRTTPLTLEASPILFRIRERTDRKSTRLNSSHSQISYAVFCLKKKKILDITSIHAYIHIPI